MGDFASLHSPGDPDPLKISLTAPNPRKTGTQLFLYWILSQLPHSLKASRQEATQGAAPAFDIISFIQGLSIARICPLFSHMTANWG
jgi:hypothetical protein